ncbi:putative small lipoprotein YifL [Peribacillus deserti]|uniref:Small lipoprotein YifL n=1 Tax=Peribacillus deserti TaxID=673318 RepID=A0ABS2QGZ1_9BACI|nr:BsuPI-related putative proteinase inhibitor [Peribacillus deserti]MBM7692230.1 putative small lipoprotein YifL [Peribacillus deserti]
MRYTVLAGLLLSLVLAMAACGTKGVSDPQKEPLKQPVVEKKEQSAGIVAGSMEGRITEGKHDLINNKNSFTFTVKNQTEKEQSFKFPNGFSYDYILIKEGKKIEQYSENVRSTQAIRNLIIPAGGEKNYEVTFENLEKGEYMIEFIWQGDKNIRASMAFNVI